MEILTPHDINNSKTFLCNICLRYLPEEKRARDGKKIRKHCTMCKAALVVIILFAV